MSNYRQLFETARDRLNDMLRGDDGQAWKEAQRFVDGLDDAIAECDKQAEPVAGCGHESCDCRGYCQKLQSNPAPAAAINEQLLDRLRQAVIFIETSFNKPPGGLLITMKSAIEQAEAAKGGM